MDVLKDFHSYVLAQTGEDLDVKIDDDGYFNPFDLQKLSPVRSEKRNKWLRSVSGQKLLTTISQEQSIPLENLYIVGNSCNSAKLHKAILKPFASWLLKDRSWIITHSKVCEKCGKEGKFRKSLCADCSRRDRIATCKQAFFKMLWETAKGRHKILLDKHRCSDQFALSLKDLTHIYERQKGLCFLSHMPLKLNIKSDFKCSIERLDVNRGYVLDNIVFICHEFNYRTNWSAAKLKRFENLSVESREDVSIFRKPPVVCQSRVLDGDQQLCLMCEIWKSETAFGVGTSDCITCRDAQPRRVLQRLLANSRCHANKRGYDGLFQLTFDDLVDLYKKQSGLCYITGKQLQWKGEFKISVDRINPKVTYTKKNCALILQEFNMPYGGAWTRQKYKIFEEGYLNSAQLQCPLPCQLIQVPTC